MKSLSDATSIQSAQQALDTLCTEYIKASGILDDLNESNKNLIATRLQGMGVANAEEMVEARLAAQKYATANGCIDLANATWEEISALIAEGNASQETQQYLANLALSKIDVNNIKLDTKADVDNIIAIANAAGASAAQIAALKTALASLSNAKIDKWANSGGGMNSLNLLNPGKLNTPSSGNSKIDQFAKQQQAQKTKDAVQDATDTLAKTLDDIKNGAYNLDASNFYANYSGGSATSKAVNDAAKAAKDAAKDVKEAVAETFDFIENGINRFDKALSKLEDKVDKTSSSFTSRLNAYKEALNAATFGIELLTDDYNKYMQKANEVGLNEDIASAVRGGASNIWDYSDDTVKQQIKDYQSWYDKAQDCLDKIDELKDKQLELTQASIELLITQYEKLSTKVENANDRMEKWISLKESWGFSANTKNYDSMNKNIQKQIDFIIKQDEQLKLLQKTVTKGSEAWYEYNERIDSNKASLIDLKQQMQENATAAAELAKATADKKTEKYDSQDELYDAKIDNATSAKTKNKLINKKISNITKRQNIYNSVVTTDNKNLKSAKKTIGKFKSTKENKKVLASIKKAAKADKRISQSLLDNFTKYGTATIGLHKTNYDNYLAQADEYQREYNKIMRQIEKGELSLSDENVIQRLRDLQDAHRDAKKSAEDELQSIQDLVKQGYEAQTDALSELIDKYKKLKDSELEAYKYQKEIAEKTKTIASLQKQLTAYNGNDSEESRAQIQKLKVQLEEAKSDLKDTQYEKFISDTEDMLDDLMTDYQKFIDEKLNDTNTILDEIKTLLGSDIIETIKGLDSNLTNDTKDQIGSSTTNGGDGGQAAKDYVHNTVTNDQNKVNSKTDTSSYDPAKEADIAKKKNGIAQKKKAINGQRQSFQNQIKELESQLKQLYGELNSIENKYQFEKSSTKNKDKLQDLKNNYIEKKSGLNAMIQDVTHNKDMLQQFIADLDKQSAQLDKDLASINGYEKGSEHIDKRQLAWTQENKRELIYRAADGALLTELNPGDKVFTNEMTENLWELAKTNPSLLYSSTNFVPKLPEITKSAGTSTIVEVGDIVMNGVNDVETFGRQLREEILRNGKTTQCITEAVSAKQLGKNGVGNARLYK